MNKEIANQFVMDSMGENDPRHKEWADKMQRIIDKQEKDEMTDQYKELREYAQAWSSYPFAKQILQLLAEMEAVGAGGVSGKGSVALEPGVLKPLDNTGVLKSWVSLINQADDETKATLRMGLKEEIELMFSRSIEVAPEYGDWIEWKGGENPVPGKKVQVKFDQKHYGPTCESDSVRWDHVGGGDITSYRVVK